MTSADIRDVLSISNSVPAQKKKKVKPLIDPAIKNATGITRELYSLLGEGTAPIAFIKQDRFKDKPKLNKKAAPWYIVWDILLTDQVVQRICSWRSCWRRTCP